MAGSQKSKIKASEGCVPSKGPVGDPFLAFSSYQRPPAFSGLWSLPNVTLASVITASDSPVSLSKKPL